MICVRSLQFFYILLQLFAVIKYRLLEPLYLAFLYMDQRTRKIIETEIYNVCYKASVSRRI